MEAIDVDESDLPPQRDGLARDTFQSYQLEVISSPLHGQCATGVLLTDVMARRASGGVIS